ncbi:MAG TPA: S41 family peptidase [Gemmatimonadaceae bacterium]|nr:S41 family peptidase [Gemmatimonadaceae bacterium]
MRPRAIIVAVILTIVLLTGGALMERGMRGAGSAVAGGRLFEQVMARVATSYVDSVPLGALYDKATTGLLEELDDPHSVLLRAERLRALTESTSGRYGGVGIQMDLRDGWITVVAPLPGSPAARAGIQTGDRIVEIEGKTTEGWTGDEASKALRGEPGTPLDLVIERPGVGTPVPVHLEREIIKVASVSRARMLGNGVGYVDLTIFSERSARELREAVEKLRGEGMRSLVLDLRGNPGGLLDQGVQIAELFLDPGSKVVATRGRTPDATRDYTDDDRQSWPQMPIVVLLDHGSASASEIVAGALQDQDRAAIVGERSFGKGSAQSLFPLGEDGALKLTTAKWYTPLGRSIDRHVPSSDDDEDAPGADGAPREQKRTSSGRVVYGGGGIVPDVVLGDTARPAAELALEAELGRELPRFRDAVVAYALELRGSGAVKSPDYAVTPAMRDAVYERLQRRGIRLARTTYDAAEPVVTRVLDAQIARFVFGPDVEFERALKRDRSLALALQLLNGAASPEQLLERTTAMQAARSDSTKKR